jgi:hypothetical protein
MRCFQLISIAGLLALVACNSAKKPSNANFTKAINDYLTKHGEACTVIGRQFPIDIPRSEQNEQFGIGPKLSALEQAGLVHATDTTAVVHGMLDPLRGSTPPQPVKQYELTADGKKYFQQIPGTVTPTSGFCYGQKTVDSIIRWTVPQTGGSQSAAEVRYTYRVVNLAPWAERSDVQRAFPEIPATLNGASKVDQVVGLELTSNGWAVPGS